MQIFPSIFNILTFLGAIALCATGTWIVLRKPMLVGLDRPDTGRKLLELGLKKQIPISRPRLSHRTQRRDDRHQAV